MLMTKVLSFFFYSGSSSYPQEFGDTIINSFTSYPTKSRWVQAMRDSPPYLQISAFETVETFWGKYACKQDEKSTMLYVT